MIRKIILREQRGDLSVTYDKEQQPLIFTDFTLRPGFLLSLAERKPSSTTQTVHETENAAISLGFNLHHHLRSILHTGGKRAEIFDRNPGDYAFCYLPNTRCTVETYSTERVMGLSLHFSLATFQELFQEVPQFLQTLFPRSREPAPFYRSAHSNRAMLGILHEILACPYSGSIRRVFLEAKALELVAVAMAAGERHLNVTSFQQQDEERIREAYHFLCNNLQAPLSLSALSRKMGINRNKLNAGFKQLYGNTVFNVLRTLRLVQARDLLLDSEKSLADIAFLAGYSDQANFTTAFRRQFGQTPLAVRRQGHVQE